MAPQDAAIQKRTGLPKRARARIRLVQYRVDFTSGAVCGASAEEKKFKIALAPCPGNLQFGPLPVPVPFNQPNRGLIEYRGVVYGVMRTEIYYMRRDIKELKADMRSVANICRTRHEFPIQRQPQG